MHIPTRYPHQKIFSLNLNEELFLHMGLFCYNQLTLSVKPAPVLFQHIMDAMLTGFTGTAAFTDASESGWTFEPFILCLWTDSAIWISCPSRDMSVFPDVNQVSEFYIW